ncbi:ribokinase [Dactylosporangium sp. NPDC051485]|uniref:ribokinase n=1 Tax=Dactylosporangium sp. NPDC051485 TaxID=3154846 RepID=UPI00341C2D44
MSEPGVVVVGSLNMDLRVRVPRLPRPGETVPGGDLERGAGGKGGNQAVAARRLGVSTTMIGRVGDDEFADQLSTTLAEAGVDIGGVTPVPGPTGTALILVDPTGENMITISPGANGRLRPDGLGALNQQLRTAGVLLLQLEIPIETCLAAARLARAAGVPVVLNAAPLPPTVDGALLELIVLADLLVVNETEAAGLISDATSSAAGADPHAYALALRRLGPPEVVVTLGADGAVLAGLDGHSQHVPAFPIEVLDAVGAGDAFCAELAVARATGERDLHVAVRRACAAGALAATRLGAQSALPSRPEVDALLSAAETPIPVSGKAHHA